jgi:hypothetical protein
METYENSRAQAEDRGLLYEFLGALDGARKAIWLDECRLWAIHGKRGYISTWGDGKSLLLHVQCKSRRHWTWTKKRLSFCTVTQDGDQEGCLKLSGMPTREQSIEIRSALGIHRRIPRPMKSISTKRGVFASPERLSNLNAQ